MKKLVIILLCVVAYCSTAVAQNGPKFKFKDGETYDFGDVPMGPDVTHNFEFTNVGNQPLIVQQATPSCSCTTPEWPKAPVMPGKSDVIKVGFHTDGHPGRFNKEVYLLSNAPAPNGEKRYTIYIKGNVIDKKK